MSESSSQPASPPPPSAAAPRTSARRLVALVGLAVLSVGIIFLVIQWAHYRLGHSITEDAFVEAHIVNVAPQSVSGHIVRILVEENAQVKQGDVLAEIDPIPYQDRVDLARSRVSVAEAELRRQQSGLQRLRAEVPLQVEIAKRTLAAAEAEQSKAEAAVRLVTDETEKGIDAARAALKAAEASAVLARLEYDRFSQLFKEEVVPLRRQQEVTKFRDSADAEVKLADAKLASALAARTRIDVAQRDLEAVRKLTEKAVKTVALADTGYDQIKEVELLTTVKERAVEEARRGLESAENDLKYTQVRAPFPAVVVKRFRNLGDFASPGVAVLSLYNPDLLYVTANLEETRLPGIAPGNAAVLHVDALAAPLRGRVVWINKSTGAQFALMPRNVVAGEFTKVVQRVPIRIWIERDERWPQLRAGLSVHVAIAHGDGDAAWAQQTALEMSHLETRYNRAAE